MVARGFQNAGEHIAHIRPINNVDYMVESHSAMEARPARKMVLILAKSLSLKVTSKKSKMHIDSKML